MSDTSGGKDQTGSFDLKDADAAIDFIGKMLDEDEVKTIEVTKVGNVYKGEATG